MQLNFKILFLVVIFTNGFYYGSSGKNQKEITIDELIANTQKFYSNQKYWNSKFEFYFYATAQTNEPVLHETMLYCVDSISVYSSTTDTEYFAIQQQNLWVNHAEKWFKVSEVEEGNYHNETAPSFEIQLKQYIAKAMHAEIDLMDRYIVLSIEMKEGQYSKVQYFFDIDTYSIDKISYFNKNAEHGFKSEMIVKNVEQSSIEKIEAKKVLWLTALKNNTVQSLFKNYQLFEIE